MNRLLSRPALALSRTSVRNGGGHVMNDETIMHWKKVKPFLTILLFSSNFSRFPSFSAQFSFALAISTRMSELQNI